MNDNNKLLTLLTLIDNNSKSLDPLQLSAIIINVFDYIKQQEGPCRYGMGHVKLQKVMWTSYIRYFNETQKSLIDGEFLAYKYGPVLKEIFMKYKNDYPKINDFTDTDTLNAINETFVKKRIIIDQQQLQAIIDSCLACYNFSGLDLSKKSHRGIWNEIYDIFKDGKVIPFDEMATYYKEIGKLHYEW